MADADRPRVQVRSVRTVSPHNQALYEAGKSLLVDSIAAGREFCKFMITTNMAAIPVYLALLRFMLGEGTMPGLATGALLMLPAVVFLAGASVSVVGFLPRQSEISLDLPGEIDAERRATMRRRRHYSLWATALFALAAFLGAALAIWATGIGPASGATAEGG